MQRIIDANAGADLQRASDLQRVRAHRRAGHRQHGIDADRAQQGALARHIRAAHQQNARRRPQSRHHCKRVPRRGSRDGPVPSLRNAGAPSRNSGNGSAGVFVRVLGERQQRFKFAEHFEPRVDDGAVNAAPSLGRERGLQRVHQQQHERRQNRVAARFDEIDDGGELGEGSRGVQAVRR